MAIEHINDNYFDVLKEHYISIWEWEPQMYLWDKGPIEKLNYYFKVLEFAPTANRSMWTYATCGMSSINDQVPVELHLFSSKQDPGLIELLTSVAFFHKSTSSVDLWHTLNFGKSWQDDSASSYGLVSLPYLDGPQLENLSYESSIIKCYWLIPITPSEVSFKELNGIEALETAFEKQGLDYLDPKRKSFV